MRGVGEKSGRKRKTGEKRMSDGEQKTTTPTTKSQRASEIKRRGPKQTPTRYISYTFSLSNAVSFSRASRMV